VDAATIKRTSGITSNSHCNRGRVLQRQFHIASNAELLLVMCGCPSWIRIGRCGVITQRCDTCHTALT
jgi:hypothetical protein